MRDLDRIVDRNYEQWTARECEAFVLGVYSGAGLYEDYGHRKSYDPLTFEEQDGKIIAHSYLINMFDGGRHHEVPDYATAVKCAIAELAIDAMTNGKCMTWLVNGSDAGYILRAFNVKWHADNGGTDYMRLLDEFPKFAQHFTEAQVSRWKESRQ